MAITSNWVELLNSKLSAAMKKNSSLISYAIATTEGGAPRVRYVVHRGFLNERRPSEDSSWTTNPTSPHPSSTLIFTTDLLSPKVTQLLAATKKSGSGAPVELSWWLEPVQCQFRIQGDAFVLPGDWEGEGKNTESGKKFSGDLLKPAGLKDFSWTSEHLRHFRKLSPALRASFLRPEPGTPIPSSLTSLPTSLPHDLDPDLSPVDKENIKISLKRMALVLIKVREVDMCDLSGGVRVDGEKDGGNDGKEEGEKRDRRWKWSRKEGKSEESEEEGWEVVEVSP